MSNFLIFFYHDSTYVFRLFEKSAFFWKFFLKKFVIFEHSCFSPLCKGSLSGFSRRSRRGIFYGFLVASLLEMIPFSVISNAVRNPPLVISNLCRYAVRMWEIHTYLFYGFLVASLLEMTLFPVISNAVRNLHKHLVYFLSIYSIIVYKILCEIF